MPAPWTGILEGTALLGMLGLVAVLVASAALTLRGGGLRHAPALRLTCPRLDRPVDCTIVQDVRTGQWKQVLSCTALPLPACDQDCAQAMNLGFFLAAPPTPGRGCSGPGTSS